MVGQGGGAHREDCVAKEVQQCPTVSMCFVLLGFMDYWLGPQWHEVERLWTPKWAELARSLGMLFLKGTDVVTVGA